MPFMPFMAWWPGQMPPLFHMTFSPGMTARLLLDRVRPCVPRPGMPMLGSRCSSFHLTPERSGWSGADSGLARARSCSEDDLATRLENLPRPELLAFLLRVDEAGGSIEVS